MRTDHGALQLRKVACPPEQQLARRRGGIDGLLVEPMGPCGWRQQLERVHPSTLEAGADERRAGKGAGFADGAGFEVDPWENYEHRP